MYKKCPLCNASLIREGELLGVDAFWVDDEREVVSVPHYLTDGWWCYYCGYWEGHVDENIRKTAGLKER